MLAWQQVRGRTLLVDDFRLHTPTELKMTCEVDNTYLGGKFQFTLQQSIVLSSYAGESKI